MRTFLRGLLSVLLLPCAVAADGPAKDSGGRWFPDLAYGEAGVERQVLDASIPPGEGPFPAVVLIHGGGWGSGDKRADFGLFGKALTDAGVAWFSINYRLAPEHRWPACLDDVRSALGWVRKNAGRYGCDPERIALAGYSAGGQLAALAAIRDEGPLRAVVGFAPAVELVSDSRRRGEVSLALRDLLDLPEKLDGRALERIAAISPAEEVRAGLPPFLLVQGTADKSVRHEDAVAFRQRLAEVGVECRLMPIDGAPHRIAEWPEHLPDYAEKAAEWLAGKLAVRE